MLVLIMQKSNIADNQQARLCERSWLGGIIDGEGYIGFQNVSGKHVKSKLVTPRININNTNLEIIERSKSILCMHNIAHFVENRKGKKGNKCSQSIIVSGCKRTLKFLDFITPYLVNKRPKAILMQEFCATRLVNKRKPYNNRECEICIEIIKSNSRGKKLSKTYFAFLKDFS
jgi:hypothetical protein